LVHHAAIAPAHAAREHARRGVKESEPQASATVRPLSRVAAWLPTIGGMPAYSRGWLRDDVIAGITLSALMVPVGMGYAEAAGLPPIAGLYATIGPLVMYFLVGPSRILIIGPDSPLLPLIATAILPLAAADPSRAIALGAALSVLVGLFCFAAALARLGFLTDLLSRPIRVGYMNGIALTILVGQLPKLLGFKVSAPDFVSAVVGLGRGIADGRTVLPALLVGGASILVILGLRRVSRRIPGVLIAVILAAIVVALLGLKDSLAVVGEVPRGLSAVGLPLVSVDDILALAPAALGISLISFADTSVVSRTFAARAGDHIDPDRELGSLGLCNVAAGLVGGFPCSGTATRTPLAETAGAKTQVAGLVAAGVILLLLLAVPGLFAPIPSTALAAVVISAALGLFDIAGLRRLWQQRRSEIVFASVAFLAVVLFGALPGIAAAVALSLLNFIRKAWRPHDAVLGRVTGLKGYHDIQVNREARLVPGLVLYRWDAPLFFANADNFRERALQVVDRSPTRVRWFATAAEAVTDIDTSAADAIEELITALSQRGVELHFAEVHTLVKTRLETYGIYAALGADHFHPTLGTVVRNYVARYPDVGWRDWEDDAAQAASSGAPATAAEPDSPGEPRPPEAGGGSTGSSPGAA
jgi:high affinity sulfate transporter 1